MEAEDWHLYLELLREYSMHHRLRLWAYNLMTNHTHLIAVPETESALSKTMRDTHSAYASAFNRKYQFTGHLWQARFYSCVLDDAHLTHAVRTETGPRGCLEKMSRRRFRGFVWLRQLVASADLKI